MKQTIKVCVRLRPLEENETKFEGIQVEAEDCIILENSKYFFDKVFEENSSNEDVYNFISSDVTQLFQGMNVSIIAYGSTGTGKSYTLGTQKASLNVSEHHKLGIIPRLIHDLFRRINEQSDAIVTLKVSFVELNRDIMHDLLSETNSSFNFKGGTDFKAFGLSCIEVANSNDAISYLKRGSAKRKTSTLKRNALSSRTHALFTIYLELKIGSSTKRSKIVICDLAGSERMDSSKSNEQAAEGININIGLSSLRTVITQLSSKPLPRHIKYRDSSLTKLLEDSLGGNSLTTFISCISRACDLKDTKSTINFSILSRKIENKVSKNVDAMDIKKLREEITNLKRQLEESHFNLSSVQETDFETIQEFLATNQTDLKEAAKNHKLLFSVKPALSKFKSFLQILVTNERIQSSEASTSTFSKGISNLNWLEQLYDTIVEPMKQISQGPSEPEEQNDDVSMTEEYLHPEDDSIMDDEEKDPPYRATPLYKQRKRKRPEDQAASTLSLDAPSQPKYLRGRHSFTCSCSEICDEHKCECKLMKASCNYECKCPKINCEM